mmetsp:Transcript_22265/g.35911  ORF Transcript_22265/g.35911 Transcript_22265/m.35911 type:complete len:439 (+) Transcript_22265:87-1403(+)
MGVSASEEEKTGRRQAAKKRKRRHSSSTETMDDDDKGEGDQYEEEEVMILGTLVEVDGVRGHVLSSSSSSISSKQVQVMLDTGGIVTAPVAAVHLLAVPSFDARSLTIKAIKQHLRLRGLPLSGLKSELVERLNCALARESIDSSSTARLLEMQQTIINEKATRKKNLDDAMKQLDAIPNPEMRERLKKAFKSSLRNELKKMRKKRLASDKGVENNLRGEKMRIKKSANRIEEPFEPPENSEHFVAPNVSILRRIKFQINRAPVMALWAVVVAERIGHCHLDALSLGRAVSYMSIQSKGERLGLLEKKETNIPSSAPNFSIVGLLGRPVPALKTEHGLRGLRSDGSTVFPKAVKKYFEAAFSDNYGAVRHCMKVVAQRFSEESLSQNLGRLGYDLYTSFRPQVPDGEAGWGAKATFDCKMLLNCEPASSSSNGKKGVQ